MSEALDGLTKAPNLPVKATLVGDDLCIFLDSENDNVPIIVTLAEIIKYSLPWEDESSDFQAVVAGKYNVDSSGGEVVVAVPTFSPNAYFTVHDITGSWRIGGANNLIVHDHDGNLIGGEATDFDCDLQNATVTFVADETTGDWRPKPWN